MNFQRKGKAKMKEMMTERGESGFVDWVWCLYGVVAGCA